MPDAISTSETIILHNSVVPLSDNNNADSITPKTGFIKPNTDILDTGLCFSRIPHNEKATAETKAR